MYTAELFPRILTCRFRFFIFEGRILMKQIKFSTPIFYQKQYLSNSGNISAQPHTLFIHAQLSH